MTRRQFRHSDRGVSIDEEAPSSRFTAPRWDDEARYSRSDDEYGRQDPRRDPYSRDGYPAEEHERPDYRERRRPAPQREAQARHDDGYPEPSREQYYERRSPTDRRAGEGASVAESLDSMNAWIERTQQQLNQTAEAASRPAAEPGETSVAEAMAAIRRIEERMAEQDRRASGRRESDANPSRPHGPREASPEGRASSDMPPKSIGRRPLKPGQQIKSAVDEIRTHQTWLEGDSAPQRRASGLPALGTLARSQTAMLTTLKQEVSKLASRIEEMPRQRSESERVQREVETLRQSMASVVRRDDLARLEKGLLSLTDDIMEMRRSGEKSSLGSEIASLQQDIRRLSEHRGEPELANLQAEIRRLSELRPEPVDVAPIARDIQNLSHKLDQVANSGVDHGVIASLTDQIEHVRRILQDTTGRQSTGAVDQQLAAIRREIAEMGSRQADSRELADLRETVADLRASLGDLAKAPRRTDDVERTLRDLGQTIEASLSGLASRIDRVDNSSIGTLSEQIEQVRHLLGEAAPARADGFVDQQLADIRRELSEVVDRQIGPREFAGLRDAVAELRASVGEIASAPRHGDELARAVREIRQPIEETLASLVDKVERVERRGSDPEALDHLERQIELLASRIGSAPGRDPSVAALEMSMNDILGQVSSWRDGAIEAAERAARAAVAETIEAMPVASEVERHLMEIGDRYAAAEERTRHSLAAVQSSIADVTARLASLEIGEWPREPYRAVMPGPAPSPRPGSAPPPPPATSLLPEADQPFAPSPDEEILLEPGASRPPVRGRPSGAQRPSQPDSAAEAGDSPDIKASFIAAARRAAQAAAAESEAAAKPRGAGKGASRGAMSPSDIVGRVRRLIDSKRRPLLLAAAAIVLALGTVQIVRTQFSDRGPVTTVAVTPAPARPAAPELAVSPDASQADRGDVTAATTPAPVPPPPTDPTTTQSIGPSSAVATKSAPSPAAQAGTSAKEPARIGESAVPVPAAPAAKEAGLGDPSVILPVGLKQAADRGDMVALYELAVRTTEGRGVPRDQKAAMGLFTKAADKGLVPAQYRVGNAYERGIGAARDIEQAKSWYRRAAMGGNVRAMHNLAVLLADGGGAKPDYAGAVEWFSRAAEHGVKDSQFNLAVLYARGLGTAQDLRRAFHWLAIAASQGDEDAARKRDEVAQRFSPADLARAKEEVQRWRATPAAVAANEVLVPPEGFPLSPATAAKRHSREARI